MKYEKECDKQKTSVLILTNTKNTFYQKNFIPWRDGLEI